METNIQKRIEMRKNEDLAREQEETVKNEQIKQKREENKNKIKNIAEKAGDVIKTGATITTAIPHAITFAIGAGAGSLIPKLLEELEKRNKGK